MATDCHSALNQGLTQPESSLVSNAAAIRDLGWSGGGGQDVAGAGQAEIVGLGVGDEAGVKREKQGVSG